ncbi:MAG: hypothetical protein SVS85_01760, partial [Candidatus Nanohaloarchaea archaeon]|nr:hypothetical protein [Candidatus Nanohaloarchaea archaeon]
RFFTKQSANRELVAEKVGYVPNTDERMQEELDGLESLKDEHILKIIETLPRSEQEVNALFSKERVKLDDSEVEKIVEFAESVGSR